MMAAMMVIMMRKSYHVVLFTPNLNISISFGCIRKMNMDSGFRQHKRWTENINDFEWYSEWPINYHVRDKQRAYGRCQSAVILMRCVYVHVVLWYHHKSHLFTSSFFYSNKSVLGQKLNQLQKKKRYLITRWMCLSTSQNLFDSSK